MEMVVGFAFDGDVNQVLLVRKTHPAWQAGKLNGIGGKLEDCDLGDPTRAMHREFCEETGITEPLAWTCVAVLCSGGHTIHFFRAFTPVQVLLGAANKPNDTGEMLELHHISEMVGRSDKIPNLSFLVPLAAYTHDLYRRIELVEIARTPAGEVPALGLAG